MISLFISRRFLILIISSFLFIFSQFYRASLAIISTQLMSDLKLNTHQLSLLSAAFFYSFAIVQLPIGIYLDRIGPRKTMTSLNLVAVAGALLFAHSDSPFILVIARVFLGIGMACNFMGALKLLTKWFGPDRFATLSGIVVSAGTAGNIAATTPLALITDMIGWRGAFTLFGLFNLLLTIFFLIVVRDQPAKSDEIKIFSSSKDLPKVRGNIILMLNNKDYWIISFSTFCRYGIFAAVQSLWAGPYLMITSKMDSINAGNVLFLMNIGFIMGAPIWGWLSDRVLKTRKKIVITGLSMMAVILILLALLSGSIKYIWITILFTAFGTFASTGTLMYTHIKELMPFYMAGTAMTGINFFTMAGAAIFLQVIGSIMQLFFPGAALCPSAFQSAFCFCAICLVVAAALYSFTREI